MAGMGLMHGCNPCCGEEDCCGHLALPDPVYLDLDAASGPCSTCAGTHPLVNGTLPLLTQDMLNNTYTYEKSGGGSFYCGANFFDLACIPDGLPGGPSLIAHIRPAGAGNNGTDLTADLHSCSPFHVTGSFTVTDLLGTGICQGAGTSTITFEITE